MIKKRKLAASRESMTLPDERYRAIVAAARLMRDLCDPRLTPRVPRAIRNRASGVLRHYPDSYDMQQLEAGAPHVVQQRMEPLYKMLKQHEMGESVREELQAAKENGEL